MPLVLLVLAVVALVAAAVGIGHFRWQASVQTRSRLVLADARADANREDALEWRVIANRSVTPATVHEVAAIRARARMNVARLPAEDRGGVGEAFDRYSDSVERELTLLAAGRLRAAEQVDDTETDPRFAILNQLLDRAAGHLATRARQTDSAAVTATWVIVGVASSLVIGLLALFYRTQQRTLEAAVRQRELEERVRLTRQLSLDHERAANHDALTGLSNRRFFLRRLDEEVAAATAQEGRLAVLLVDLDHFKEVNDTLGHQAGDVLLQQLAPRLRAVLREHDVLARLGGDEFALLIPADQHVETSSVIELAERLGEAIAEPFDFHGVSLQVHASVGIALLPAHGTDAERLLRHADVAMYRAKADRNGYALYAAESDTNSLHQLALTGELRTALDAEQLVVHYQPKADLRSGKVASVEALVRWQHPTRGLLAPDDFLPTLERAGLMRPLTLYVLTRALAQCAEWSRDGIDLAVAVNLSVANLTDRRLPGDVAELLRRHGVEARKLQLEITENLLMADPATATEVITKLAELDVTLSLDDFGTGYSSLTYLKRLNVDEIKIDRSFVIDLTPESEDAAIVRSIVELARSLGLRVVAEGVESKAAWEQLRGYGCDQAQGYYLSRPVPAEDLTVWIKHHEPGPTILPHRAA